MHLLCFAMSWVIIQRLDIPISNLGLPHKPFSERRKFLAGLCKRAGIKSFGFHALRRFVASVLADSGKSTNTIRRILRHRNVSTTELYIQNINNDLRETLGALGFNEVFGDILGGKNKKKAQNNT
jgi:integrase